MNSGFGIMMAGLLAKQRELDTIFGPDCCFFAKLLTSEFAIEQQSLFRQLKLVVRKLFPYITSLSTSSSIFFACK